MLDIDALADGPVLSDDDEDQDVSGFAQLSALSLHEVFEGGERVGALACL